MAREEITRNNRGQEVFFVNGRLVKSVELSQTLEESYYTLIAKGRFPIAVLKLTLPGSELDVNVHPAKTEIKINGYEQLKPQIIEVLKDALWEANITKNAFLPETVAPAAYQIKKASVAQIVQQQEKDLVKTENSIEAQNLQKKQSNIPNREEISGILYDTTETIKNNQSIVAEPEKLYQWKTEEIYTEPAVKTVSVSQEELFSEKDNSSKIQEKNENLSHDQLTEKLKQKKEMKTVLKQENETVQLKGINNLSVIGQLNNSFILAQNAEGLYIIDQHTCHERILYEKFMKAEAQKEMISQPLLIPVTVTLSAQQDSVLMQNIFTLRELGFVLENFGDRCYLLRSLPLGLNDLPNVEEFFLDLLHDLSAQKDVTAAVIKEKLLITASCKGAVKAHWPLTDIEMRTLLHDLSQVENAHTCPHGRPIVYKITMAELYKIFKRGSYHG